MEFHEYAKKVVDRFKESVKGEVKTYLTRDDVGNISTYIADTEDDVWRGTKTIGTIGILKVDTGYEYKGKPLVSEVLAVVDSEYGDYANVLGSISTNTKVFGIPSIEGAIHKDVISMYYPDVEMKHIVLTQNMIWDGLYTLDLGDKILTWLIALPISDKEMEYINKNGLEKLLDLFEEKGIFIADLDRESVI